MQKRHAFANAENFFNGTTEYREKEKGCGASSLGWRAQSSCYAQVTDLFVEKVSTDRIETSTSHCQSGITHLMAARSSWVHTVHVISLLFQLLYYPPTATNNDINFVR